MSNIKKTFASLFTLVLVSPSYASDSDFNYSQVSPKIKAVCQQAFKISIPSADLPNQAELKNLEKCTPIEFYYGIHQAPDYRLARLCAFAKKDYGTLTMIYANGKGVSRNWDLALQFACRAGFAPGEIEGRVQHLLELRGANPSTKPEFDFCDDVTSGYMAGVCAEQKNLRAQAERDRQFTALMLHWSEDEKKAWVKLQHAAQSFFNIRSNKEVDLSGSARAELLLEEQDSLQNDLLTSLQKLSEGHFPNYTDSQVAQYDHQLNQIYQEIQKNNDFSNGTITRQSIKETQLAWLKYRDAWVDFGRVKYPQVNAKNWQTWLTQKRIEMLQELNSN